MPKLPRLSRVPRRALPVALAVAAVLPTAGFVAVAGGPAGPDLRKASSSTTLVLADDRADVAAYGSRLAAARRDKMTAWYQAVLAQQARERRADQQRASRGEPRQDLTDQVRADQYWRPTTGPLTQPLHDGHKGIDIGVPVGTPVVASADGVVAFSGVQSGYGNHIEVRHADGKVTTYSHLDSLDVAVGQPVRAGQRLAASGNTGHSTGPHLHFEVRLPGGGVTDPIAWLQAHGGW